MTTKLAKRKLEPNGTECPVREKKQKSNKKANGVQPHAASKSTGRPASQVFKKRKSNGYVGPSSEEKKINKVAETFRRELETGVMAMSAIRHFLQEAYANPDIVMHYIRCGGTFKPLLTILASCEKDKLNDIADLLHLVQLVLLQSLDCDETHMQYATKCVRSIMTNYQTVVCSLLQDQGANAIASKASALRLLKAVLLVDGQSHWRDVLRLVDTCCAKMGMVDYRESILQSKGYIGKSLRTVFIEFNLAFLIDTPTQLVRFWLARHSLVHPLVLNLVFDSMENVVLVMKTLRQYVLDNPDIDKYIYRTAFTPDILKALVHVYEWVGPEKQIIGEQAKQQVLSAVEEFVLPLLTSRRCFLVPKTIDLERASPRYRQLLQDLRRTQLHEHQRRLVLGMLEMCPEVLPATLDMYGGMLKSKKEETREMVKQMLLLYKPDELIGKLEKTVSAKALSTFVVNSTLPRTVLEHIGTVLDTQKEAIAYSLELLTLMVTRCEECLQAIESSGILDQFGRKKVKVDAINKIVAMFPSVDRVMAAMEIHRSDRSVLRKEIALEHGMDFLLVCIRSFRAYIESSSFVTTFRDILKPAYYDASVQKHFINYEFKAIKVIIALEPQSVSFGASLFQPVFELLANAYVNGKEDLPRDALDQLLALLRNTALFGNRGTEIEFWFQAIREVDSPANVSELISYLAEEVLRAAQQIGRKANAKSAIDHSLIDEAFNFGASTRKDELKALFQRVEQDTDGSMPFAGSKALLDAQVELPVADAFFMHLFDKATQRPAKFRTYFEGVALRYLHYLSHPEIVHRAVKALEDGSVSKSVFKYAHCWLTGTELPLSNIGKKILRPLSHALLANDKSFTLDSTFLKTTKDSRGVLLNMLHLTLFYFCRWVVSRQLSPKRVETTKHYCNLLLEWLLRPGVLTERDVGELMEGVFLQRPVIFQHFTIIKRDEDALRRLVSEFVYDLMQMIHHLPHFETYTELYSNKIITELIQVSTADAETRLDGELAEKLLAIFKLNERHCVTLLRHYAQLPAGIFVTGNQRTYHYKQLCFAMQQLIVRNRCRQEHFLPEEAVRGVVRIYKECGQGGQTGSGVIELEELEQTLYEYFDMFPHSIAQVDPDLMRVFFDNSRRVSKSMVKLASFLLARSSHFHGPFLQLVGENAAKKELVYPLLNVAFRRGIITESMAEEKEGKALLAQIYAEFKGPILKMLEKPNKAAVIYRDNVLASEQLVRLCMPRNECVDFARKKLRIEAVESFQLRVLMEIYGAALKSSSEGGNANVLQTVYCNGFTVLLQCFEALFRTISSAQYLLHQDGHMQRLNELTLATYRWAMQASRYHINDDKMSFESVTKTGQWNTFCKNCLKLGLETVRRGDNDRRFDERLHVLPKLMAVLVELFYVDGQKEQTEIERYYDWALSHSNFLRLLLLQYQFQPKTALVQLMYALARKNPSVANEKHVPLLLGAYGATLTDANRYILALLQHYERSGVQMHEFRPFLWGETAIKHFSLESRATADGDGTETPGANRGTQNSFRMNVSEVFSLLVEDKMINMIENFPVWRKLDACSQLPETNFEQLVEQADAEKRGLLVDYQANTPVERFVEKFRRGHGKKLNPHSDLLEMHTINTEINSVTYDPAFLMPMMNYLYSSEQSDMLRRGIRSGILTLPFLCLSSNDEQMRLAAGTILLRIRGHLELTKRLTDSKTWLHLLAIVQRRFIDMYATAASYNENVHKQGHVPRAPYLSMLFIAETVKLLPNVLSKLHAPMTQYLINQDVYNFRMVPNFLPLFNSSDVENNVQRMFMVRTLHLGVKSHRDFAVLRASPIIQVMMGFHGSPLSNRELNMAILNLLNAIAKIPKSCQFLVDSLGFVGWLSERVDAIESFEFDTIEAFLGLLSDCWYSLQVMAYSYGTQSQRHPRSTVFFQRGILILTLKFLPLLSPRSSSTTLKRFLNLLEKTTSPWHGYQHLMSLVSAEVMQQLMEYFETLFAEQGDLLWCVRYVRQCGTFGIDDDASMGRKLQEVDVDQTNILVVLALRRFVVRWCNCQKGDAGIEVKDELEEVDVVMEGVNTGNDEDGGDENGVADETPTDE
uniref:Nucleolar pre-ribosomal-associated protein 1 C-terminal domain-containing protein n=1 Tax=Anopheles minimus TaxID=112268 RepID=A0A182WCZ3_9DIPT